MISLIFLVLFIVCWYWSIVTTDKKGYGPVLGVILGWLFPFGPLVVLILPDKNVMSR